MTDVKRRKDFIIGEMLLESYFDGDEWTELSNYEKTRYRNLLRNYERLKVIGK